MAPSPQPTVLPQFDGESDPEGFLLKYKATKKKQEEAPRARRRHSSSRYEAWPSAGMQTSPPKAYCHGISFAQNSTRVSEL